MNKRELKEFFQTTFNTVAEGYDSSAMRFFPDSAKLIPTFLQLNGDEHVLDVATGTGCVALALADTVTNGHITGIDFSQGMLSQAMRKQAENGIRNVSFVEMDMEEIAFPHNHFDAAVSAFSIFFIDDMHKQLAHIADKVKEGGKIITTTFYDTSFSPLVDVFLSRLKKYGIEPPTFTWKRVATREQCETLFQETGLQDVKSEQVECGYHLTSPEDWWYIIWNGGFRGLVSQLNPTEVSKFKEEHMLEVGTMATDKGIWLEMAIIYTVGVKQA